MGSSRHLRRVTLNLLRDCLNSGSGGIGLLVVSAAVYLTVYFMVQNGNRLGLTIGLIFAILGGLIAIMSLLGNILDTQRYGFVPLYAGWFIANVLWIRAAFDPAVKAALK